MNTRTVRGGTGVDAAATRPVLAARGIERAYRQGVWPARRSHQVLRGVDLSLAPGEVVGLVGEDGSGKSTLMKVIVGALAADAGSITRAGRVGDCPQETVLYARLTCGEHFEMYGAAYGIRLTAVRPARGDIYPAPGFPPDAKKRADQLSGGTQAKLNLGLALLADPDVLLLDEPYAGFDWDTYLKFWDLVAARRAAGRSGLIISHFVTDEQRFDRILQLRDGRAVPR